MTLTDALLILGLYIIMALWIPLSGLGGELTASLKRLLRRKK